MATMHFTLIVSGKKRTFKVSVKLTGTSRSISVKRSRSTNTSTADVSERIAPS